MKKIFLFIFFIILCSCEKETRIQDYSPYLTSISIKAYESPAIPSYIRLHASFINHGKGIKEITFCVILFDKNKKPYDSTYQFGGNPETLHWNHQEEYVWGDFSHMGTIEYAKIDCIYITFYDDTEITIYPNDGIDRI